MLRSGNKHCTLKWDGKDDRSSVVTILDTSSNGTFVGILVIILKLCFTHFCKDQRRENRPQSHSYSTGGQ
jgi:hypothetical protein